MEEPKQTEERKTDRFTSLMFGHDKQHPDHNHQQNPSQQQATIDYVELMENIDTLMESIKGFKPLFKKVSPFIDQLWKKIKAD
ncbi:MAG: hypothetical protein ABGX20_19550 [Bacillus sp. (in: firmicutes)]